MRAWPATGMADEGPAMRFDQRVPASARWIVIAATAAAICGTALPAGASTAHGSGATWAKARQVGTPATLAGGEGGIQAIACAPKGYCAAVGFYEVPRHPGFSAYSYVLTEKKGAWGKIQLINTAPLGKASAGSGIIGWLSCPSAGNCAAGGEYQDSNNATVPFVVNQKNGRWGKAEKIAGVSALNGDLDAQITALSCASAGNCVIGGNYQNSTESENNQPFVVAEKSGVWGKAQDVPGTASLDITQGDVTSLSCTGAGTCLGVGFYQVTSATGVVITEHNGKWGTAHGIPGLSQVANSGIELVSCAPAGTCTVAGDGVSPQDSALFTISEKNGSWGSLQPIPGTAVAGQGYDTVALSCPAAGDCSLGGSHSGGSGPTVPFVATEHDGTWATAGNVPGLGARSMAKATRRSSRWRARHRRTTAAPGATTSSTTRPACTPSS
ncbi:MAG TPA: hypothetical protein VMR14_08715 [Streptosporangiaceae bacterium]|nr:hypothetical protein [Streptosporangiaceae bacterium]